MERTIETEWTIRSLFFWKPFYSEISSSSFFLLRLKFLLLFGLKLVIQFKDFLLYVFYFYDESYIIWHFKGNIYIPNRILLYYVNVELEHEEFVLTLVRISLFFFLQKNKQKNTVSPLETACQWNIADNVKRGYINWYITLH